MQVLDTEIPDVKIISPRVFGDERGYFCETFNESLFLKEVANTSFVQDNQSFSSKGTFRGLHYQLAPFAQSKLVRVVRGSVVDFAVDIRRNSLTFGKHVAVHLSEENHLQLWIPRGFAHGFLVISETALFQYKVDNYYSPSHDRGIRFDDPTIGISLPMGTERLLLSEKDKQLPLLKDAEIFD